MIRLMVGYNALFNMVFESYKVKLIDKRVRAKCYFYIMNIRYHVFSIDKARILSRQYETYSREASKQIIVI